MKNDLTCGVVRDLLPSYVENLLGEESKEAVDRHLETCPECRERKEDMAAPTGAEETAEAAKEVDFLRRVKKGTAKKIALAVVCTALVVLGGLALKVFFIGTPLQAQSVAVIAEEIQDGGSTLFLSLSSIDSGNAFHGWRLETVDGVTSIYARDVMVSPIHRTGDAQIYVPLNFIQEVWLGGRSGRLIWADGLAISQKTMDLLEAKTPYCGDAPALGRIAELLEISQELGPYATTLHTSSQPYAWALEFRDTFDTKDWRMLRFCAYQMLALVGNLDQINYSYRPEGGVGRTAVDQLREGSVSAGAAARVLAGLTERHNEEHNTNWPVHESIKEYAESPLEYQRMVTLMNEYLIYRQ